MVFKFFYSLYQEKRSVEKGFLGQNKSILYGELKKYQSHIFKREFQPDYGRAFLN
jgi:hypothetical protein